MFISPKLEVKDAEKGRGIFAMNPIDQGEALITFEGKIVNHPTKTTLQIDDGKHLEGPGENDDFLNHSCTPNAYIDFTRCSLCALCAIPQGMEVTFNYLTTEWDMANKFTCQCEASHCVGFVRGFKYLTLEQRKAIEHLLSPFLHRKLLEELPIP